MKKYLIAFLALIVIPASAETLSRVDVVGNNRMDAESVRILAGVKLGENITTERTNKIAKQLQESGYFSNVSVQMDGGVMRI